MQSEYISAPEGLEKHVHDPQGTCPFFLIRTNWEQPQNFENNSGAEQSWEKGGMGMEVWNAESVILLTSKVRTP